MYLSRFEIPWIQARNPYGFHQILWHLFPGEHLDNRTFLFRIEHYRPGVPLRGLLQSHQPPAQAERVTVLGCREFHPQPQPGQRLGFVLTANPVKTIVDTEKATKPDKRSGKCRVPLIKEEQQREWLARKLEGVAEVEAATVLPNQPLYFRKVNRSGKLVTVTYEGVLRVTNPESLVNLLERGIGPAKAFGCGLMLVRRFA
ncbi:MAG: type I-E CRISPR-associated protein Cas6/Cse3/CasE [Candidatus Competibacteraceae bacterium]|jgi:CRISPR system Cascade subunit CasE|nr:type I-E CRISPR-associated protein Cas6/Cse3/CasE [Candidatus Competibacteraceae bacterium]